MLTVRISSFDADTGCHCSRLSSQRSYIARLKQARVSVAINSRSALKLGHAFISSKSSTRFLMTNGNWFLSAIAAKFNVIFHFFGAFDQIGRILVSYNMFLRLYLKKCDCCIRLTSPIRGKYRFSPSFSLILGTTNAAYATLGLTALLRR